MDILTLKEGLDLVGLVPDDIKFTLVHWGWLALVTVGLFLFGLVFYIRAKSIRLGHAISRLYTINQDVEQDALNFFYQAWPVLESVGGVQIQANIEWFGERRRVTLGAKRQMSGRRVHFKVFRDDMSFEMLLFLTRKAAGPESLSSLVVKTFINILEQDLVVKEAEILISQKRLERYQMYVQHEIKNIAQFIQLLSDQVKQVPNDVGKIRLVDRLHDSLPVMAKRARKTIQHMQDPITEMYESSYLDIRSIIQEVVTMYGLNSKIKGSASVNLSRPLLLEVFKNVLGNFSDHPSSKEPIQIVINSGSNGEMVQIEVIGQLYGLQHEMVSERLFEPFWTTSESGMGLGLFLARELLKQFDGQISFEQSIKEFKFLVTLPGLVT
ncbi:MAG: ATP-binding protein [Pseudomonadota bacterium]|nr:ATP-binding protein [Pseudomonadota bacterium]